MKQFKTLLIKEYRTHRIVFLIPAIFLAATYLFLLVSFIIGWIKMGDISSTIRVSNANPAEITAVIWGANFICAMILGWAAIIAGAGLVDHLLNHDFAKKCEIFHLSQPVSLKSIMGAKASLLLGGELVLTAILVLINGLILGIIFSLLGFSNPFGGFMAGVQGFLAVCITYIALISVLWLFACLFRKNSGLFIVITISGINIALQILKYFTGWDIYSPMDYIVSSISKPVGLQFASFSQGMVPALTRQAWYGIFSLDSLLRLLASAVMIIMGFIAYHRREVK